MQYIEPIPTEQLFLMADKNKRQQSAKQVQQPVKKTVTSPAASTTKTPAADPSWIEQGINRLANLLGLGDGGGDKSTTQPTAAKQRQYKGLRDTIPAQEALANPKFNRFPYAELIAKAGEQYGINPYMLAGVVMQESKFNPRAGSHKGASGLGQLIPLTFNAYVPKELAKKGKDPFNPEQSVNAAAAYLDDLLRNKIYKFNDIEALRAYNQSPTIRKQYPFGNSNESAAYPHNVIQRGMMFGAVPSDTAWVGGVPYPGMYGQRVNQEYSMPTHRNVINDLVDSKNILNEYATFIKPQYAGDPDILEMRDQYAAAVAKRTQKPQATKQSKGKK
jgi:hypothetical protein